LPKIWVPLPQAPPPVNDQWLLDDQTCLQNDAVRASAGDRELDDIGGWRGVGIEHRLAQRTRTTVASVEGGEGCGVARIDEQRQDQNQNTSCLHSGSPSKPSKAGAVSLHQLTNQRNA
jgi:hypothetical protein